jgi:hypothetical protein
MANKKLNARAAICQCEHHYHFATRLENTRTAPPKSCYAGVPPFLQGLLQSGYQLLIRPS